MEPIREVSAEEDTSSEINYTTFRNGQMTDSFQQLRQEVRAEVLAQQLQAESHCHSCSCMSCVKALFLTVLIGVIWLAVTVPTIYYIVAVVREGRGMALNESSWNDSAAENDSSLACKVEDYTGSVCRKELSRLQQCYRNMSKADDNTGAINVCIQPDSSQENQNELAESLLPVLKIVSTNERCMEKVKPFACLYLFPLAVLGDKAVPLWPSLESCESIRDDFCADLWRSAEEFGRGNDLPRCEMLPADSTIDLLQSCSGGGFPELNCSRGFKQLGGSCIPVCQEWSAFSPTERDLSDVLIITSTCITLLTGIAVLAIACIRRNRIFTYPSILVVYQTITPMMLALLILIGFAGRKQLFCSSKNLMTSIAKPSTFCTVTGAAFHYFILQLVCWWLFHTTAVFQGTLFPFHTKRLKASKKLKYIHASMVALGLVLPAVPMAIIAAKNPGFTLTRQPTLLCSGFRVHYNYACVVAPVSVGIAAMSTMLVFILWTIIKRHIQAHRNKLRVNLNWTAEAKVLVVILYHLVVGVFVLTIFSDAITNYNGFAEAAGNYFQCESAGTGNSCELELKAISQRVSLITSTIAFVLLGLYPTISLVYIVDLKELKSQLACMERKVQAVALPPGSHPRSRESRAVGNFGNIQSATPYPVGFMRTGEPLMTSSFSAVLARPSTFAPLINEPPST